MNDQDKIDKLEAQNRVLVEVLDEFDRYQACNIEYLNSPFAEKVRQALSNSPVELYRKEQEVIETALVAEYGYQSYAKFKMAVANLQQARQEQHLQDNEGGNDE